MLEKHIKRHVGDQTAVARAAIEPNLTTVVVDPNKDEVMALK